MSFVKQLLAKSELVRRWYLRNFEKEDLSDIKLSKSENKLFSSMERFHSLSHVRYDRLLCTNYLFVQECFFSVRKNGCLTFPVLKRRLE